MEAELIKQLQNCASISGKQRTWISMLSDEQLYELYLRLRNGESAKSIAKHIQQVWEVRTASSIHSISQGILKYKGRIDHLLSAPPMDLSPCTDYETEDLSSLEESEQIAQLQRARIKRMMAEEAETGVRHPSLSKEISALTSLNKTILKEKDWTRLHSEQDYIERKQRERYNRELKKHFDYWMSVFEPDGRRKLAMAMRDFRDDIKDFVVYIAEDDEGNKYIVDQDGNRTT